MNRVRTEAEACDTIVSLSLTAPLKAELRRVARERETSMSSLARQILGRELEPTKLAPTGSAFAPGRG